MTSKAWTLPVIGLGALLASPALASEPVFDFGTDVAGNLDALAQDDDEDEDDLGDILGTEDKEETVSEERRAVEEGRVDGTVGVKNEDALSVEDDGPVTKRTIKVLQKKNFLKIGRVEVGPHLGFVTNDPFINRYLVGFNAGYHLTEVFSVELSGTFSPDFGQGDWKPITDQLVNNNKVSPDISKLIWLVNGTTQFSPIYGKIAVVGGKIIVFDFYGIFGFGVAGTLDDEEAIQCDGNANSPCSLTLNQVHPTTTMGGGFRVAFSKRFATRFEGRTISYIETLNGVNLEMKNLFALQATGTFFFDTGR